MDTSEFIVLAGGIVLIGFVLWYFFGPRKSVRATARPGAGVQEIQIRVAGGYEPDVVRVRAGRPVRLTFVREDRSDCAERVVFPDFGVVRHLALGEPTHVELTPPAPGEYRFACGMNMMRGKLIAEA